MFDSLSEDKKVVAQKFHQEATALASQQMYSAHHVTESGAKYLSQFVVRRWYSWLLRVGLSKDTRARIKYLPFDEEGLLNAKKDDIMENLHKKITTAEDGVLSSVLTSGMETSTEKITLILLIQTSTGLTKTSPFILIFLLLFRDIIMPEV